MMGAANGGMIGMAFVDPGMENFGKNFALFFGGAAAGGFAGHLAWKNSTKGLTDPGDAFWTQDAAAGTSLLMSSIAAGAGLQPHLGVAAGAGLGLQGAELYTQRQVLSHWGGDTSRLHILASLQFGSAVASGTSFYDLTLGSSMPTSPAAIGMLLLWPAPYAVAALADPGTSAEEASARGSSIIVANFLLVPTVAMLASKAADGDIDASLAAVAGAHAATLAAGPFLPPLPGSRNARYFASFGGMIGAIYGMSIKIDEVSKERDMSFEEPDIAAARQEMWTYGAIGAATGVASGWLLGSLIPSNDIAELVPPGPSIGPDGRIAFGLGGLVLHLD